ncbi:DapH/DapD/GlmU-related protein [Frankia sp. Cj3]|uniref:acyltransferase n=2 Tax=unclassified Frankia TaxID=2632575 RepID=UPI001EF4F26C|nr:acyltransferase [Frankia sp. Cj3]
MGTRQHQPDHQRGGGLSRSLRAARSLLDPLAYAHILRIAHFYGYSHVRPRRLMTVAPGVRLAPNVSIRNGERITIGAGAEIGERCYLWAGDSTGRIDIGAHALFAPEVFVTASNYRTPPGVPVMHQDKDERDIRIGANVWLGARVVVVAGVTIGDGCIVGANSVVTTSLPPDAIAVGAPARVVGHRGGSPDATLADATLASATPTNDEPTGTPSNNGRGTAWPSTSQS